MCKLELYTMVKQLIAMADSCLTIVNFILTKNIMLLAAGHKGRRLQWYTPENVEGSCLNASGIGQQQKEHVSQRRNFFAHNPHGCRELITHHLQSYTETLRYFSYRNIEFLIQLKNLPLSRSKMHLGFS